jgi:phenylacetate-CoA ligase
MNIMSSQLEGCAWPPVIVGPTASLAALIYQLDKTQWLSPEEISDAQAVQLQILIEHHVQNTPVFAERLARAGIRPEDIQTVADLSLLPPIRKADIQKAGSRFNCEQIPRLHQPVGQVQTSGSTGEPITLNRSSICQLMWEAMTFRDHQWNKRDYDLKLCAIRANIFKNTEQPVWGVPVSKLYRTGPARGFNVSDDIELQIQRLSEWQPDILVVHAGVLSAMVTHWERSGYDLNLKHLKNVGDTVSDSLRDRVRDLTGLEIEDNYSSSETGTMAIQCPEGQLYHICSETCIIEIVDQAGLPVQDGQIGRILVTDLQNFAAPVIRYDIGDYAELATGICKCGRGLPTLRRILGRERNIFKRPDGSTFWPKAGMYELPKIAAIRQWQIVQHSVDLVEYKLVTDEPLTEKQEREIRGMVPFFLGWSPEIRITRYADSIPTINGKYEEAICLIKE